MKIIKLTGLEITDVKAQVYKSKKNKLYYNILHGTKGKDLFVWRCGLHAGKFVPKTESDTMILKDNNYILKNVLDKNNKPLKDANDNLLYNIDIDYMDNHRKDLIVLWEIPNKGYVECKYNIVGVADHLGEGITGKVRGENKYISPAPIIEVYGDVVLDWVAKDKDGVRWSQKITYDYAENNWSIGTIVREQN